MDALPFVGLVAGHVYLTVLVANTIDATGIPFPGRIVLILAGALLPSLPQLGLAILAGALGALLGDHLLFLVGQRGGSALLAWYCRLTLGSERCVDDTVKYFRRLGPSAIVLGRYSTGVRLFAAILSGCGHLRYRRFLTFDIAGTLVYATLWVTVGYLFRRSRVGGVDVGVPAPWPHPDPAGRGAGHRRLPPLATLAIRPGPRGARAQSGLRPGRREPIDQRDGLVTKRSRRSAAMSAGSRSSAGP